MLLVTCFPFNYHFIDNTLHIMNYEELTQKKAKLDAAPKLSQSLIKNLDDWFTIELTYTSNAIEGNTLTRSETAMVLEKGIAVGGKSVIEHLEAKNHAKALELVRNLTTKKPSELTQQDILDIHAIILHGIDDDNAGRYRNCRVRISGSQSVLPNPLKVPMLMEEFSAWLISPHDMHAVEFAGLAHYKLVTIHPFIDGNGRTARLLMNLLLMMHGYPPAIIDNNDRLAYINSLEKIQTGGSMDDYNKIICYAASRSLDIYLETIQETK